MSSAQPEPRAQRSGRRPRFTREQVLEAALRLIDAHGAEVLTMRLIADELGIGVMTLYGYVDGKAEVIAGAAGLAYARARPQIPDDGDWQARVRAEAEGLYEVGRAHPNVVRLAMEHRDTLPDLFAMRERLLDALQDAGLPLAVALRALGVVTSYALGFAGAQAGSAAGLATRLGAVDPARFPRLAAAAGAYDEHLSDEAFGLGLELLLSGLDGLRETN